MKELEEVVNRLNLDLQKLKNLIKDRFNVIKLGQTEERIQDYTIDPDDAHILSGSKKAKAKFLISHNIRHFKVDKIAEDLNLVVITPAKFLQYLRSIQ